MKNIIKNLKCNNEQGLTQSFIKRSYYRNFEGVEKYETI
jgi:hypothetical protein